MMWPDVLCYWYWLVLVGFYFIGWNKRIIIFAKAICHTNNKYDKMVRKRGDLLANKSICFKTERTKEYHSAKAITLESVAAFHARFENIHPFQDGNGRVVVS